MAGMTPSILARRSKEPTTCFVCQGVADSIGVCRRDARGYAVPPYDGWTCQHCIKTAKEIVNMKADDVSLIESRAAFAVAKAKIDDGIQVFIGALFDAGVDKLSEATPEQIDMAKESLVVNGDAPGFVREIVLAFGDEVKASIERGDAPF
jgi:hypothetical protein